MMPLLRGLGRVFLVCCALIVIVMLGARYWLLPHIDQWRTPIAQALSLATDSEVEIGRLSAQWQGLTPEVHVHDVYVKDQDLAEALHIPYAMARIKWRGLWQKQVHFSHLLIDGLHLVVWRDKNLQLHLAGQPLMLEAGTDSAADTGFVRWLGSQDQIELQNAHLTWRDQSRNSAVLRIEQLEGILQPSQNQLSFNLRARPQSGLGQDVVLRGYFDQALLDQGQLQGRVALQFNGFSAAAWRHWVDLPSTLIQATVDTALQLDLTQSRISEVTMDMQVLDGVWNTALGPLTAQSLRLYLAGPWQSFASLKAHKAVSQQIKDQTFQLRVQAKGLSWQTNIGLADELQMDELSLLASSLAHEQKITIQEFALKNQDVAARFQGSLTPHSSDLGLSQVDITGAIEYLHLNALYRYFPQSVVSASVVDWLQSGLVQGVVAPGQLRWQGNLAQFPYAEPSSGLFYVGGAFEQAEIDYYPTTSQEKGWPKVEQANGHVALKGNALWVYADQAQLKPNTQDPVQAEKVAVSIDDLSANHPILTVQGHTKGPAQHYLPLMTTTELGSWLGHVFDKSTATGQWQVPLFIRASLNDSADLEVQGAIDFEQNELQLMASLPLLSQVKGRLVFTEQGAKAENITAQALGGPIHLSQQIGTANEYLKITGRLPIQQLNQFMAMESLNHHLEGETAYELRLGFDKNEQFFAQLTSSLVGLTSSLPEPLNKTAAAARALTMRWQAAKNTPYELRLQLDNTLQVRLEQNDKASPFFKRGGVVWNQASSTLGTQGLHIDLKHEFLDLDAWQKAWQELLKTKQSTASAIFPDVNYVRLKAKQAVFLGTQVDQLTYTLQQPQSWRWRADISSEQIAGTISWRTNPQGQIQGSMQAQLQRLYWTGHEMNSNQETLSEPSQIATSWPSLLLNIDDLRLNAWRLGALTLQGEMDELEQQWRIPALALRTPYGELNAIGTWYLEGAKRGLKLNAQLQSDQAGAMLDYVGLVDILKEGKGAMQAQVFWHDFPWTTQAKDIQADFDLSLHQGRVNQINSKAAKLLEFLSLQSLSRLARLDFDLRGLTENGFPFDDVKGQAQLKNAQISTENVRVVGPVGTIVLEGMTDFSQEQLDLKAVVVPNLDMSGTAIAAGIALNPVVGIGAFVTQLLFKEPLAQAMAVQYHINGPWDQVETAEIKLKTQEPTVHYDP